MCRLNQESSSAPEETKKPACWKLRLFWFVLFVDLGSSIVLGIPFWKSFAEIEGETDHYTVYGALWDLVVVAGCRFLTAAIAIIIGYHERQAPPESPFELYHRNGTRKTREELENEALEESFPRWFRRYISRPSFCSELINCFGSIFCIVKCFARLDVELGVNAEALPFHPIYWLILLLNAVFCIIYTPLVESMVKLAGECGRARRAELGERGSTGLMSRISSRLNVPLLGEEEAHQQNGDVEEPETRRLEEGEIGTSDITSDAAYKATWRDLIAITYPDMHYIAVSFVFLLLAATAQVYIPKYTGKVLDSLSQAFAGPNREKNPDISIWDVPGFLPNVKLLVVASILCGIFSGLRGSIFTLVGGRVNIRLRVQLLDSLLSQDIGFFDVTKTGDITSRLSSDTTLVGDQVSLNVNVFLRSLVQIIGVLIFMFFLSWQLSLLAFISVPIITIFSKWYGGFYRKIAKLMQKKLADGNSVSEAAMSSMSTVRAFDAANAELKDFQDCMSEYLYLNGRAAFAYFVYCTFVVAQPNIVTGVVLFYGGQLVQNGDMTSGDLVSFLLYLQSLSDAFGSMGYIFSSLAQAVGAADKVFELMNRQPRLRKPAAPASQTVPSLGTIASVTATRTNEQRFAGVSPERCHGEVQLKGVEMYYPARPQRRILDDLSLKVEPGSVVALVGPSGSGKSSVMSLVQHLYEPSKGQILIDGIDVHELNPMWLSRKVSVVSQEPTLFARSVARNIMYGLEGTDTEPTIEEIQAAAKLANAHDFIEKLPFGYDTDVGERGVQLSGGQKQRIAIARALVRKPSILLLDEATSALDAESEALVQEAIDDMLAKGRERMLGGQAMTVLIVAHRLSTVRNADTIFVIQEGKVVEQGSHQELTRNPDGAYSSLIQRQMKAQQKLEG